MSHVHSRTYPLEHISQQLTQWSGGQAHLTNTTSIFANHVFVFDENVGAAQRYRVGKCSQSTRVNSAACGERGSRPGARAPPLEMSMPWRNETRLPKLVFFCNMNLFTRPYQSVLHGEMRSNPKACMLFFGWTDTRDHAVSDRLSRGGLVDQPI